MICGLSPQRKHGPKYHDRGKMSESKFPAGWDAARVRRLIEHDEALSEEEQVAEDEAAEQQPDEQTDTTGNQNESR